MLKRVVALAVAILLPYLTFVLVVKLNESDFEREALSKKTLNFDVEKKKQVKKPKPKKKPPPKRRRVAEKLPSIQPTNIGGSVSDLGLSFGIPQFDDAGYAEFKDNDLLEGDANQAMTDETVDTMPRVLRRSSIDYPAIARKQGINGYVIMNVLINAEGNVEEVEIVDSKPKEIFDLQADSVIRRWKFEPATYNGKKVKVWATQKVTFKLE